MTTPSLIPDPPKASDKPRTPWLNGSAQTRHGQGRPIARHRATRPASGARTFAQIAVVAGFITTAVAANTLTAHYGLIGVGFGLTATAGTWAAGLILTLRDLLHDLWGRTTVYAAILAAALASAGTAGPQLALASGIAFALSELADLTVYTPLRRHGWARAVLASNIVGATVDSLAFLTLAGFAVTAALPGQLLAKTTTTIAVVLPVLATRALLRHRLRPPRP